MTIRRLPAVSLHPNAAQAILEKEALIAAGGTPSTGTPVSSASHPYIVRTGGVIINAVIHYIPATKQPEQGGIGRAYEKAVTQLREANVGTDEPRIEEPVPDSTFTYPADKVVNIQKGRKLNRKA